MRSEGKAPKYGEPTAATHRLVLMKDILAKNNATTLKLYMIFYLFTRPENSIEGYDAFVMLLT